MKIAFRLVRRSFEYFSHINKQVFWASAFFFLLFFSSARDDYNVLQTRILIKIDN